eukprot:2855924-Prymnesium_polylepis.1
MTAPHVCAERKSLLAQCHDGEHMCTSYVGTGGLKALPITHYVAACRPAVWRSLSGSAQNRPESLRVQLYFRDDRLGSVMVATGKGAAVEET